MEPKTELQTNAIVDARKHELVEYQRALDTQWMNNRMEDSAMARSLALIQRERQMEKEYHERTDHAAIVNETARKEVALAKAVAEDKHQVACELLRRHYLRERDPALRELMQKLQAAYVCRDQKQQILNNEYKRLQEKTEQAHANNTLSKSLETSDIEIERKKYQNILKYREELQQQLINKAKEKQCQYEDSLIEKKMLDDILRTIYDEDMRELKQKQDLLEKTRTEMQTFQQARLAWREKQKQLCIQEEKNIEKYQTKTKEADAALVAERERKQKIKDELNDKVSAKIIAEENERREREDIIQNLQLQESLEKAINEDIHQKEMLEKTKMDTKQALEQQMKIKKKFADDDRKTEIKYRQEIENKLNSYNQTEQDKELKKKQLNKQYALDLKKQMEQNAERRKREKEDDEKRAKYVFDYDKAWQNEVQEERSKIIKDHVPHVFGYIKPGVIHKPDVSQIKEGAQSQQIDLDIDRIISGRKIVRYPKCNAQCRVIREY